MTFMEDTKRPMKISEDHLSTLEGWLRYQGIDAGAVTPDELDMWRDAFREVRDRASATPKAGLMKLKTIPGERRYAVAVCDGSDLWLTLWVRRSRKPEFFVMVPRGDSGWDAHTSYHNDGKVRVKSHGTTLDVRKCQPLTGPFRGTEHSARTSAMDLKVWEPSAIRPRSLEFSSLHPACWGRAKAA